MRQHTAMAIAIIVIATAVVITLVMRKDLCEVRIKSGYTEVAVFMDYEPK